MKPKEFLIIDIETTSLDIQLAQIKVFGAYDPYEDKYYIYKWNDTNLAKVVELLSSYKLILTFNGLKYDLPIMERHSVPTNFRHVDVRDIFKHKRGQLIRPEGFESYSLKGLVLALGLDPVAKGEIDYAIFQKLSWTIEEQTQIITYLKQDLLSTWKLWSYLIERFKSFEKFLPEKDKELYKHITTPLSLLVYKIICHGSRIMELYDELPRPKDFPSQIISTPRKELTKHAALFRFTYLYTHTVMQFNLASIECECCPQYEGKFHGKNFYNIKGYYCQKRPGRIERFLQQLYNDSNNIPGYNIVADLVFKKIFDVFTNPLYYSTYDPNSAYDLYLLAKQQLKLISNKFEEAGFLVIYIDMDQVFIDIPEGKTLQELLHAKEQIIAYLKTKMTFPSDTFDLLLCDELRYLKFFRYKPNEPFLHKGKYLYINTDGFIGSKGVDEQMVSKVLGDEINETNG